MAKLNKQTQSKRVRELKKKEKRESKREKMALRKLETSEANLEESDEPPSFLPTAENDQK